MSIIQAAGSGEVSTGFYDHLLDQSLKFDDGKSSALKRTPASAGNQRLWTFSAWVKKSTLDIDGYLLGVGTSSAPEFIKISNSSTDQFEYAYWNGSTYVYQVRATALLRDTFAWYHIVLAVDTAQGTAANRVKFYVNGTQLTEFSISTYPTQNADTRTNAAVSHRIGSGIDGAYFDGYIAEVNFIDGSALTPSSFGETKNGIWIPKDTSGLTFGTNGFHLTFKDDVVSEGFNTVTYTGTGADNSISGIGFSPDFVWIKSRTTTADNMLFDTPRGALKIIKSNSTAAEITSNSENLKSFDGDGFTYGSEGSGGGSGIPYVAWCWEAGGTPTATNSAGAGATPTAGSVKIDGSNLGSALAGTIPATKISANTARGFSIVGYEATGSAGTIAHGLSAAPELIIVKHRDQSGTSWPVYYGDNTDAMYLNDSGATSDDANAWNDTSPTSTVFSVGANGGDTNNSAGGSTVSYCFHSVAGYSKIGTFTGNGGSQAIDVGFEPAFVMLRRTSGSTWGIFDNLRGNSGSDRNLQMLAANSTAVETTNSQMTFSGNTFNDNGYLSDNGTTVLYMAFADTREAAFFKDVTTNGNHFVPVNLDYRDSVPDTPTNNFCTLNPLDNDSMTLSNGNLTGISPANAHNAVGCTFGVTGGKWYWEVLTGTGSNMFFGMAKSTFQFISQYTNDAYNFSDIWGIATDGQKFGNGSGESSYGSSFSSGDILQLAFDLDNGKFYAGKNGTYFNSGDPAGGTNAAFTNVPTGESMQPFYGSSTSGISHTFNFGQDSSFGGLHATANSNADGNGHGSFAYAPPSGYLALCSQNLPDAAITDGTENFNTVLYTGDGASSKSITGVGFSPDWVWAKNRVSAYDHALMDSVRGASAAYLSSNNTASESTYGNSYGSLTSFDSDGFSVAEGTDGTYPDAAFNQSSEAYVAWNWLAGTAFSNDASATSVGNVDSSGQVNTTAGFSIVSWQYTTSADNLIAHGLSSAPEMIILKSRTTAYNWDVYHSGLSAASKRLKLNSSDAEVAGFFDTAPTSTVFEYNTSGASNNDNMIAYCFHSVEGYCKVGGFSGNNATTFVHTGFRVAWLMIKNVNEGSGADWGMFDNTRPDGTGATSGVKFLQADITNAEGNSGTVSCFFFSNGFEIGTSNTMSNKSGDNFIYLAFADQPFKFANAR